MDRELMKMVTKAGGYSVAMTMGLLSVLLLLAAGKAQAAETVRLFDGSFAATASWGKSAVFTPPCDGKLVMTFENPDASADSTLVVFARKPTDYYPSKLWERPVLSGYTFSPAYLGKTVKGFATNTVEFSAFQNWGQVTIAAQYDLSFGSGLDNTGTDRVTMDFVPETIQSSIPQAQYLTRLISQPYLANETSVDFTAVRPGKLILHAVRKGSGGGGHMVYLDGYGIGGIDSGEFNYAGATYKTLQIREAGSHVLKISHEDPYFWDNSGVREVAVYFLADEVTDKQAPSTTAVVTGTSGENGWLLSDATVLLTATDDTSGVKEIHYTVDGGAETVIAAGSATLDVTSDGIHTVSYFAVDNAGNVEAAKPQVVKIDRTPPTVDLDASLTVIWPPNHKLVDVTLNGTTSDSLSGSAPTEIFVTDSYGKYNLTVPAFGSTVQLEAWREGNDLAGRTYVVTAVTRDLAGNSSVATTQVLVPHDMRDK